MTVTDYLEETKAMIEESRKFYRTPLGILYGLFVLIFAALVCRGLLGL